MLMEAMGSSAEAQRLSLEPHPVFGCCLGQCSGWCSERLNFVCAATCGWGDSMVDNFTSAQYVSCHFICLQTG